jgi:hypothetical protein
MSTETLLLIVLIVLLVGAIPVWPYSQSWGYAPGGVFTLVLVIFLIWALAGGRPLFRSTGSDIKATVQDAGQDLKSTGRDVASSIRRTVQ